MTYTKTFTKADISEGTRIKFNNGLVHGTAVVTLVSKKTCFKQASGDDTRYILQCVKDGRTQICEFKEITSIAI